MENVPNLFEDLRGPQKYMLLGISRGNPYKHGDHMTKIHAFIQQLFGILGIYYT